MLVRVQQIAGDWVAEAYGQDRPPVTASTPWDPADELVGELARTGRPVGVLIDLRADRSDEP